ncbi:MAG: malonic semialdehyde reductase [SAR324 cluster bacterium]|uniref:Putative NADH dehydrogenase/NAD(P)H nitroreductase GYA55_06815 n=1 Tax=SAR324 cluster bacterium TaxID=2024889 RepID=A0A7X9FRK9_9DELT|nr:malonic semialdehyde reductase [SAR324 cluster bacterium]
MERVLDKNSLDILFREARTYSRFLDKEVTNEQLQAMYELMKMGPTGANTCPARIIFLRSTKAKERLKPALAPGNVDKTMKAPVTAIVGGDLEFYEKLPLLFPHTDARSWFVGNDTLINRTAFQNSTLQGAYLIMAARAVGLDCGPMSGFDNEMVDREFFPDGKIKSNLLCNLGVGDPSSLHPRNPRLAFEEVCSII